jgi:CRISPR-associated protein Cas2
MKVLEPDKKFVIVAYDITQNRRRTRIMKKLKGMGFHIQKSVFECLLTSGQIEQLRRMLLKEADEKEDTIRLYILPLELKDQVEIIGSGEVLNDKAMIVI